MRSYPPRVWQSDCFTSALNNAWYSWVNMSSNNYHENNNIGDRTLPRCLQAEILPLCRSNGLWRGPDSSEVIRVIVVGKKFAIETTWIKRPYAPPNTRLQVWLVDWFIRLYINNGQVELPKLVSPAKLGQQTVCVCMESLFFTTTTKLYGII